MSSGVETRLKPRRSAEVNIFRYVPGNSVVFRMWAGTKLICLAAIGIALFASPTWPSISFATGLAVLYALASRLPRGVLGRPPRWFYIGLAFAGGLSFLAFGEPSVRILGQTVGLGGLLDFLRFTALGLVLAAFGLLLGWTTSLADVAAAVDRLAAPARVLHLPVDEHVVAIGLAVRCLPLLADDVRTLHAAWRMRQPAETIGRRDRIRELIDLLVASLVASLRRAREMGDAMEARGGPVGRRREKVRIGAVDILAVAVVVATVVAMAKF